MKTLSKLFLICLFIYSCDKENDPIIGTWFAYSYNDQEVDDCTKKTNATFKKDGTFSSITFDNANIENKCKVSGTSSGTWSNIGKNKYRGKFSFQEKTDDVEIVFDKEKNLMIINKIAIYKKINP